MAGRAGEERGRERPLRHPQPHAPQDLYRATQGDAGVCVCVCPKYTFELLCISIKLGFLFLCLFLYCRASWRVVTQSPHWLSSTSRTFT